MSEEDGAFLRRKKDLVFYNRVLHCNIIIEFKDDEFRRADLSQLNAYISYFRDNEMNKGDNFNCT
jgi:hypothetical protein